MIEPVMFGLGIMFTSLASAIIISNWKADIFGGVGMFIGFVIAAIGAVIPDPNMKPIDVYRGKTELKITETKIDSVVIKRDTVVVWKEK